MRLPPNAISEYAPLVYEFPYRAIFQGDQPYYPSSVEWFLNQIELNWGNGNPPYQPAPGQPFDQNQLTKALPEAYLQIPNDPTATSPIRQGDLSSALAYMYMRPVDGTSNLYDLQYWLFYPVRGRSTMRITQGDNEEDLDLLAPSGSPYQGAGEHQGDWKHIAVRIDDQGTIQGVYYTQQNQSPWINGDHGPIQNDAVPYDTGLSPSVGQNSSGYFIEVHQSQNNPTLFYNIGQITADSSTISWVSNPGQQYAAGITPAVAMNDSGLFVEVHQSQDHPTLWYDTGRVDPSSGDVTWLVRNQQYDSGIAPAVALNDSGLFIEVHQSQNNSTLWYHIGQIDPSFGAITWLVQNQQYDNGTAPAVALNNAGLFVEVHQSQNNPTLWCDIGSIDPDTPAVTWITQNYQYDTGQLPKVALPSDSTVAMEVHQAGSGDQLYCHSRLGWW